MAIHNKVSIKKIITKIVILIFVFFLFSCSSNQNNASEIDNIEPTVRELNSNDLKDMELYLIKNGYQNLILSEIQDKDDGISKEVVFNSYIPISPMKCKKSSISLTCEYDNQKDKWKYKDINSSYEGVEDQPRIKVSLSKEVSQLEEVVVPFSWGFTFDYENYHPGYKNGTQGFERYYFYFQNDICLILNHTQTSDPFDPDYTTSYEINDFTVTHVFYEELESTGTALLVNKDSSIGALLRFKNTSKEEQLEIMESMILDNYEENDNFDNINPNIIDYNEELFRVRLKYNMRMRAERNQGENIIRRANKGEEFSVYKVLNDGKFIWYCIGEDMWLGDDGTCIEFIETVK